MGLSRSVIEHDKRRLTCSVHCHHPPKDTTSPSAKASASGPGWPIPPPPHQCAALDVASVGNKVLYGSQLVVATRFDRRVRTFQVTAPPHDSSCHPHDSSCHPHDLSCHPYDSSCHPHDPLIHHVTQMTNHVTHMTHQFIMSPSCSLTEPSY